MSVSVHSWDGKTDVLMDPRPSAASNQSAPTLTNRRKHIQSCPPPVPRSQSIRQEPTDDEAKRPKRAMTFNHLTRSFSTMLIPERPIAEEPTFRESLWAIFRCSCTFWFRRALGSGS